jgi:hypothetical protein
VKNASKLLVNAAAIILMSVAANATWADLNASSQTKVHGAQAKKWSSSSGTNDAYNNPVDQKKVVNIGNGGCSNVNIGSVVGKRKPGEKAPKEIVVTTKEVINICK